jgi:hypothetical protein
MGDRLYITSLIIYLAGFLFTISLLYVAEKKGDSLDERLVSREGMTVLINKKVFIYFLAFIPFWVLISFRDKSVGIDSYGTYYRIFRYIKYGEYATHKNILNSEVGYIWLNKICILLGSSYRTIIFITATITWTLYFKYIIENSTDRVASIAVLFASFSYFHAFNGIRQFMAMAIVLQGMKYIYERRFIRFFLVILIATTFHKSALILLILYFLYGVKIRLWWATASIIGSIFAMRLCRGLFASVLGNSNYGRIFQSKAAYSSGFAWTDFICNSVLLICGMIVVAKDEEFDKKFALNVVLQLMSVIIAVNSNMIPIPYRLLWYTNINTIIYVPQLLEKIKLNINKVIVKTGMICMYFLYFSYYWLTGVDDIQKYVFWKS